MPIDTELERIQSAKSSIKSMIESKSENVVIPSDATLDSYPTYLESMFSERKSGLVSAKSTESSLNNRIQLLETSFKQSISNRGGSITGNEHLEDFKTAIGNIPTRMFPVESDWTNGVINGSNWEYQVTDPPTVYSDIYQIKSGVRYCLLLGSTVGNAFRVITTQTDVRTVTEPGSENGIPGTIIVNKVGNDVVPYVNTSFTAAYDGYLTVTKSSLGVSGISTYLVPIV